jgi:hypothetical protein
VACGKSHNDQTSAISFNLNLCTELLIHNSRADVVESEIKENKTPGGEQYLDPPGADLLAWL